MNLSHEKIEYNRERVESAYINSCELDLNCIKPGNVNYLSGHHDTNVNDFVTSYRITSKIIASTNLSLGARVVSCVSRPCID